MGISQLLGGHMPGLPPKVYTYVEDKTPVVADSAERKWCFCSWRVWRLCKPSTVQARHVGVTMLWGSIMVGFKVTSKLYMHRFKAVCYVLPTARHGSV